MTEEPNGLDVLRFYPGMPQGMLKSNERLRIAALGAKGAGLVRLSELDMPCPEGLVNLSTLRCFRASTEAPLKSSLDRGICRYLLKQAMPTLWQIKMWDRCVIRLSRILDPLTRYCVCRSVVGI